ncbi:CoA-transferase family III [Daldinia sp. FL1419]|nr:CoA-transferase family III [Daldinia sp. FL1419]
MGSLGYSVPQEAEKLFQDGILNNPLMKDLPRELHSLSRNVQFEGSARPSIPINWRFAESISAMKAFEATMLNYLITKKYNIAPSNIKINTDHATLFFMSPLIARVIKDGNPVRLNLFSKKTSEWFPNRDLHRTGISQHRALATNIYKTKDGRFYHVHGSMNPDPTLTALGLPRDGEENDTYDSVVERIQKVVSRFDSAELDELVNEKFRQAGTIARTSDEYFASEHGQAAGKVGLYETTKDPNSVQPASWWPENESYPSSPKRPLAGLKVVDLARVIAGPAITRSLAEMGASVMRVTSPNVTDISALHQDLNWGKWNCFLDLKNEADKEKLRALIREADVVVDGYRPGVMERLGFGRQAIFDLVKDRPRGIIAVRENCYGWHGPWSHRSGWQQISDACCGVSMAYGRAMGNDEAVTPVFPNSDYCTGLCGSTGVLEALARRAEHGGSYGVDVALNYYSQWLVRSVGAYDEETWNEVWKRHGSPVFRHYHAMPYLLPAVLKLLYQHDSKVLFNPAFFHEQEAKNIGATFVQVKPIAQFANNAIDLGYHIGTRGNGVDEPIWPDDLKVEVVRGKN